MICLKKYFSAILLSAMVFVCLTARSALATVRAETDSRWQIAQLVQGDPFQRFYPGALTSLIEEINRETTLRFDPDPVVISDFEDPRLFRYPILYINYGDRRDWDLSPKEQENLRRYLDRGGFIFIDSGITAEFLRGDAQQAQSHSFAEWEVTPVLADVFAQIYPDRSFEALPRSHPIFRSHHSGLPDPSALPEAIRGYVTNEKWPQGTYSFVGLEVDGRLAALATPIVAMGWGRNELGQWTNPIGFRVREDAEGMSERLREASHSGNMFTVAREDGLRDRIYTQPITMPAWVEEPDGRFRLFRYYQGTEISDYAHQFYTQLGVNIFVYALTP
jgi:hypothetical protein